MTGGEAEDRDANRPDDANDGFLPGYAALNCRLAPFRAPPEKIRKRAPVSLGRHVEAPAQERVSNNVVLGRVTPVSQPSVTVAVTIRWDVGAFAVMLGELNIRWLVQFLDPWSRVLNELVGRAERPS